MKFTAVFFPEQGGFFFAHNEESGGKDIRFFTVFADDGHRAESVLYGLSCMGIKNMMVPPALCHEVPLVVAGGDNGRVGDGKHPCGFIRVIRVAQGDVPWSAAGFRTDDFDISS